MSASSSKIKSDYGSVTEQSAIRAGDKGFDVDVKGDTDLKGGAITSTQQAIDNNKNSFKTGGELTTSDIENKAEYKAKSTSVNVGTGLSFDGALKPGGTSAGFGKDGDKAESMTLAAILVWPATRRRELAMRKPALQKSSIRRRCRRRLMRRRRSRNSSGSWPQRLLATTRRQSSRKPRHYAHKAANRKPKTSKASGAPTARCALPRIR
ncbi:MAG: hypothetical protein IPO00_09260 [Betaproteobacteria bacterium]|nr:hypothetical protein [Betaproteobacteria bacterium]